VNQRPPSKPSGHAQDHSSSPSWETLGDFSVTSRTFLITALAIPIGLVAACFSLILLRLISFFTNVFYFGKFSLASSSPANHHLGWLAVFIPVIGAVIVGLMARYGSDRIRGHGIPEAIESILLNGSRIQPKIALLKPVSAAIAIGSGGPFGAEGPIIMTGGAFGSMIAQMFHLTSAERKTLLVAGAAAGMSATFAAPVSAVLLAIELLLFERKPRSIIPVALASGAAAFLRHFLLGDGPLFPAYAHASIFSLKILLACLVGGFACGLLAIPLSNSVYKFEELFARLPIHWMWWPALGGLVVGLGGLIFPPALGVGYDVIGQLVQGDRSLHLVLGVLISYGMPDAGPGFWALIGITGVLSGALRVPLTAIIFTVEQTHDWNLFLPLMLASVASYAASTLLLRRSILTEKVARRGYHLSCEYSIDPLELLYAREVMRTKIAALSATSTLREVQHSLRSDHRQKQRLLPVVDPEGRLTGVVTRGDIREQIELGGEPALRKHLSELVHSSVVAAYPDEPLRIVVHRMAEKGITRLPVVERDSRKLLGLLSLDDLLKARSRHLEEERHREQTLRFPFSGGGSTGSPSAMSGVRGGKLQSVLQRV
jgi:chloride channel protein, CIC family